MKIKYTTYQIGVEALFTQMNGMTLMKTQGLHTHAFLYTQHDGYPSPPIPKTSNEIAQLCPEQIFNDAYTHCENQTGCTDFYIYNRITDLSARKTLYEKYTTRYY